MTITNTTNRRILIADDEPYILRSLSFVLQKEGFEIETACDGVETLEKARQFKPKILFLDIMMPLEDGYEVCEELKSAPDTKDIYVIMLTAKGQIIDKKRGLEVGADEYITKPFSPREIVNKVKEIIGS
ncbi:MAG TPA: two-component system response regulator [Candidatus Atribacteria bacterium]|nr:two-component system response regulator [Candidatus Atribacteria bacterium]